ncbi:unnamed protein product, partial [Auanema sp. JU1783]
MMANLETGPTVHDEMSIHQIADFKQASATLQKVMERANPIVLDWRVNTRLASRTFLQQLAKELHEALNAYNDARTAIIEYRCALTPELQ